MKVEQNQITDAYKALATLIIGGAVLIGVLVWHQRVPTPVAQNKPMDSIHLQRLQAIEQAKKEGKSEYSFTVQKPPLPINP